MQSFGERQHTPESHSSEVTLIPCPKCGTPSGQIKSLRTGRLTFLIVASQWRTWTEVGCPSCVQQKLFENLGLNLITAHVLWPVAILPWISVQLVRTLLEGHSPEVLAQLGLPTPPSRPIWVQFQERFPTTFRIFGGCQVIVSLVVFAFLSYVLGDTLHRTRGTDYYVLLAFTAIVGAVAGYPFYSGISKLLGRHPHLWHRIGLALVIGLSSAALAPGLAAFGQLLQ